MPLLLMALVFSRISKPPVPVFMRPFGKAIELGVRAKLIGPQTQIHFDYIESELGKRPWFAGDAFTAADVQMSFPLFAAESRVPLGDRPRIRDWLNRARARPAFQRAIERGGPVV